MLIRRTVRVDLRVELAAATRLSAARRLGLKPRRRLTSLSSMERTKSSRCERVHSLQGQAAKRSCLMCRTIISSAAFGRPSSAGTMCPQPFEGEPKRVSVRRGERSRRADRQDHPGQVLVLVRVADELAVGLEPDL